MGDPLDALLIVDAPVALDHGVSDALLRRVDDSLAHATTVRPAVGAAPSASELDDEILDEALDLLHGTASEFEPFGRGFCIANHAPMTADALCVLGRPDAVIERTVRYRKYLADAPRAWHPIAPDEWRAALGDYDRAGDWVALFERELAEAPWTEVLDHWVPRLAPGSLASGTHGVLRTAHATRSLARRHTPERVHELAEGLGFWAARYETLPEVIGDEAGLLPSAALGRVEQLDEAQRRGWLLFTEPIERLSALDSFADATNLVDTSGDPTAFLDDLVATFARVLASNASVVLPRALVHGLTAGSATRMLLPWLSPEATAIALRYGWQLTAAFYAAMVLEPPAVSAGTTPTSRDELVEEALACGDEHAIKALEACLDTHSRHPDPVLLAAARETTRSLMRTGLSLP